MIVLTIARKKPPKKAVHQLDTSKPNIKLAVIRSTIALITKPIANMTKKPNGNDSSKINGLTSRLTIPNKSAADTATTRTGLESTGLILIPGMIQAVANKEMTSTIHRMINR
jgi:hypothetical protein